MIAILAIIIILQFVGPSRPENYDSSPADLIATEQLEEEVATLLRNACYDCHSMESKYPWYANIAPVKWMIYDHIYEGREELNFSEWANLEKRAKIRKLKDIAEEVEEGEMPMESYVKMHAEANLTDEQRAMIVEWANDFSREVMRQ